MSVRITNDGAVRTVTIDRPDCRNAVDPVDVRNAIDAC